MTSASNKPIRLARLAGALLFLAAAVAFMGIITAESLYSGGYSTGQDMISDLGGTEPPDSIVVQPSAAIFNAVMTAAGSLIAVAAVLVLIASRRKSLAIPLALFGLGVLGVGVFPGDTGLPHQLFAQLAFIGGGVAAILAGLSLSSPLRYVSMALGATALVNLGGYMVLQEGWFVAGLGLGGLERWVAYPILLWVAAIGGYLMGSRSGEPLVGGS